MLNFQWTVSILIDQVYFLKRCMVWKENSRAYFGEIGSFFFGFCNTISSGNLQKVFSRINSGIAQFSTKRPKNNRPSVSFYKITGIKGQLSGSIFMELGSFFFFGFCNVFLHPQGDLFSWPLYRLHHQKKFQNSQFFLLKIKYIIV